MFHHHKNSKTFEEEQLNDRLKMDIAFQAGIKSDRYIILDCCQSNYKYIKNSVMNSSLPLLLGFSEDDIDWNLCDKFASSSRLYEACEMWNNGIKDKYEIAQRMHMHKGTINRYIKRGFELGFINS